MVTFRGLQLAINNWSQTMYVPYVGLTITDTYIQKSVMHITSILNYDGVKSIVACASYIYKFHDTYMYILYY